MHSIINVAVLVMAARAQELFGCTEYCKALRSGHRYNMWRPDCECTFAHQTNKQRTREPRVKQPLPRHGSAIYYEPSKEYPNLSFSNIPFHIVNPTFSKKNYGSRDNPKIRKKTADQGKLNKLTNKRSPKQKQAVEHVHKLDIELEEMPLYLDIDIQKSIKSEKSSEIENNGAGNLNLSEKDLTECIDLHIIVYSRKTDMDNDLKELWDEVKFDKYKNLSDSDLMIEIQTKCSHPSKIVNESVREIKNSRPKKAHFESSDALITSVSVGNTLADNDAPKQLPKTGAKILTDQNTNTNQPLENNLLNTIAVTETVNCKKQIIIDNTDSTDQYLSSNVIREDIDIVHNKTNQLFVGYNSTNDDVSNTTITSTQLDVYSTPSSTDFSIVNTNEYYPNFTNSNEISEMVSLFNNSLKSEQQVIAPANITGYESTTYGVFQDQLLESSNISYHYYPNDKASQFNNTETADSTESEFTPDEFENDSNTMLEQDVSDGANSISNTVTKAWTNTRTESTVMVPKLDTQIQEGQEISYEDTTQHSEINSIEISSTTDFNFDYSGTPLYSTSGPFLWTSSPATKQTESSTSLTTENQTRNNQLFEGTTQQYLLSEYPDKGVTNSSIEMPRDLASHNTQSTESRVPSAMISSKWIGNTQRESIESVSTNRHYDGTTQKYSTSQYSEKKLTDTLPNVHDSSLPNSTKSDGTAGVISTSTASNTEHKTDEFLFELERKKEISTDLSDDRTTQTNFASIYSGHNLITTNTESPLDIISNKDDLAERNKIIPLLDEKNIKDNILPESLVNQINEPVKNGVIAKIYTTKYVSNPVAVMSSTPLPRVTDTKLPATTDVKENYDKHYTVSTLSTEVDKENGSSTPPVVNHSAMNDMLSQSSQNIEKFAKLYVDDKTNSNTQNDFIYETTTSFVKLHENGSTTLFKTHHYDNDTSSSPNWPKITTIDPAFHEDLFETQTEQNKTVQSVSMFANSDKNEIIAKNVPGEPSNLHHHFTVTKNTPTSNDEGRLEYPEGEINIPKIITKEYYNDKVVSEVSGSEILPNNDFEKRLFSSDSSENKTVFRKTSISQTTEGATAFETESVSSERGINEITEVKNTQISNSQDIVGKLVFLFGQVQVPARFVQNSDGEIKLGIDGITLCNKILQKQTHQSIIMNALCKCSESKNCANNYLDVN